MVTLAASTNLISVVRMMILQKGAMMMMIFVMMKNGIFTIAKNDEGDDSHISGPSNAE